MKLNEYQTKAFSTALYPEKGTGSLMALVYVCLGLGEVGEIQGKLKKVIRDSSGEINPEVKKALIKECGDTLWYIGALATELGVSLEEIAEINLLKLSDRKERGVIGGSGDER